LVNITSKAVLPIISTTMRTMKKRRVPDVEDFAVVRKSSALTNREGIEVGREFEAESEAGGRLRTVGLDWDKESALSAGKVRD
jgi:hypothetical protein